MRTSCKDETHLHLIYMSAGNRANPFIVVVTNINLDFVTVGDQLNRGSERFPQPNGQNVGCRVQKPSADPRPFAVALPEE